MWDEHTAWHCIPFLDFSACYYEKILTTSLCLLMRYMSTINAKISKILVPLDDSESAMKAADYALLITKGLNAKLLAIHVVRSEDALIATNSLIEDLETVTTGDSILQKVKADAEKWFNAIKQKSSTNGIQLKTGLLISPTEIEDAIVN